MFPEFPPIEPEPLPPESEADRPILDDDILNEIVPPPAAEEEELEAEQEVPSTENGEASAPEKAGETSWPVP